MKVAVCAIAKNENRYIKEWAEWYKTLGFSKIYIFDNNDFEGEKIKDVISNDEIVYVDETYRNKNDKFYQSECYTKFYNENKHLYDWILFCDIDEFLIIENYSTIQEFLKSNEKFNKFDGIAICWKVYDDNDYVYYSDKPIVKRFTRVSSNESNNTQMKSLIRCIDKKISVFAHGSYNINYCDVLGNELVNIKFPRIGTDAIHKECWLNHYRFKTIEEFILSKYKNFNQENIKSKYIDFEHFFLVNEVTNEKLNVIKSFGFDYTCNNKQTTK